MPRFPRAPRARALGLQFAVTVGARPHQGHRSGGCGSRRRALPVCPAGGVPWEPGGSFLSTEARKGRMGQKIIRKVSM